MVSNAGVVLTLFAYGNEGGKLDEIEVASPDASTTDHPLQSILDDIDVFREHALRIVERLTAHAEVSVEEGGEMFEFLQLGCTLWRGAMTTT